MEEPEENFFLAMWRHPRPGYREAVSCVFCHAVRYTSFANYEASRKAGMRVVCATCAVGMPLEYGGTVHDGKVVENYFLGLLTTMNWSPKPRRWWRRSWKRTP
jgi:hypothetical protein